MNVATIIGNHGVSRAKSYFEKRGYMVSCCPEGQPTDCLVTETISRGMERSKTYGIQVKTTKQECVSVKLRSWTTSGQCIKIEETGGDENNKSRRDYIPGDFDIQCYYVAYMDVFLFIPFQLAKEEISIKLRPPLNNKNPFYYYKDFQSFKNAIKNIDGKHVYKMRFSNGSNVFSDGELMQTDRRESDFYGGIKQMITNKFKEFNIEDKMDLENLKIFKLDERFEDPEEVFDKKINTTTKCERKNVLKISKHEFF
jgi:hypothetical protein